jgi:hypothetical protein
MIKRASTAIAISAFGLALGAGASSAADQQIPCGSPAVPAVYDWVVTQPAVPEVSHLEYEWVRQTAPAVTTWRWQRTTTTTVYRWKLTTSHVEDAWSATSPGDGWVKTGQSTTVVTQPAVTETRYEFRKWNQKDGVFFGDPRWEPDPVWNAKDANGKPEGWERTDTPPQEFTITPAVTETRYQWQLTTETYDFQDSATSPGDGWEQDGVVSTSTQTEDAWSATQPEGNGWTRTDESRTTPATYEQRWAATRPGGEWVRTDAEPKTVVDVAAVQEQKEWQVVVPAIPAGEPCREKPPVEQPPVEEPPVDDGPVTGPVDAPAPGAPEGKPTPKPTPKPTAKPAPKPASAVPQVGEVAAVTPTRLAYTGSDLTLLWTGVGLVVVGAGLGAGYRRVSRRS